MARGLAALDIHTITAELQDLTGAYIEKIYQLTPDTLLLKLKKPQTTGSEQLFIRNEHLLCLTTRKLETPETPSVFAMTLRKYLQGGRLTQIHHHDFDRILTLTITKGDQDYHLILELYTHGNIILTGPDHIIIRPLRQQTWAKRIIRSNQPYLPPTLQTNPLTLTPDDFTRLLTTSTKDLVRTLAITINLSGLYAEELCHRTGIDKNTKTTTLTPAQLDNLYTTLTDLLTPFTTNTYHPVQVTQDHTTIDILPIPLHTYPTEAQHPIPSFTRGLDAFIDQPTPQPTTPPPTDNRRQQLQRQLHQQQQQATDLETKIQTKKLEGDLIYLHYQPLDHLLTTITDTLKLKDKKNAIQTIKTNPLVTSFNPETDDLTVTLNDHNGTPHTLPLDFRKNVSDNAQNAYNESKKLQEKLKGNQDALTHTQHTLHHLTDDTQTTTKPAKPIQHKHWYQHYRWFITTQGNIVVAGRDARTNEQVVKKYLTEGDRYLHADIHGAPSVIIKHTDIHGQDIPITDNALQQACIFAASYSRAWSQYATAQAYWVTPEQVSKTPETGEYVPKGAFIIRGKRNYHQCTLQLAIGLVTIDGDTTLMGGPLEAIQARATTYILLTPGATKKPVLSKKIAAIFHVSTEEADKVLPPGNATITTPPKGGQTP